ncbi:histidinol-phosphatase HisJ family protein [Eubacterium oxidoreducens]|uniref:Histidinol-phosphatase n=1 Tax=Eubacterium oxidoreducens TaxID=1732 RepID=A0A1G6B6E4_EUBOX|nr:histidinol-phosphatase HisJ family protein [Eubacterium oxidoreducens]SDB16217.1 histidinol-phosphatase (PHP family) [Eubacterium oxidoreducens]
MLYDCHMHTRFSGDSTAPVHDMLKSAKIKSLSGLCFTDHLDLDYPGEEHDLFLLDLESYVPYMQRLKAESDCHFHIGLGIELGLQPHLADTLQDIVSQYPFDFVIGSSHVAHHVDPYYPQYYEGRTEREAYEEYFEATLENINAFSNFDVYGHIDYVVRYGPNKDTNFSYQSYSDHIDAILKKLIELGKGIEINTGGYRSGLKHPNPREDILLRYRELGGEILTLGADAHTPQDIAYRFEELPKLLTSLGFTYFTVFKERKPCFYPL